MPSLYTQIGPWTVQTFTLVTAVGIITSAYIGLRRFHFDERAANLYLMALLVGLVLARLLHVLLNWDYFGDHQAEIWNLSAGGLDWHGGLLGGVFGLALAHRFMQILRPGAALPPLPHLLAGLVWALPLIGLSGWYGCMAAGCGYGKEVWTLANFPSWVVWESADVFGIVAPRYSTQRFGLILCGLVGLALLLRSRRTAAPADERVFWFTLALLSAGMFVIGFFRADHTLIFAGLRGDQVLDLLLAGWAGVLAFRSRYNSASVQS